MKRINNITRHGWQANSNCAVRNAEVTSFGMILDPKQYVYLPGDLS